MIRIALLLVLVAGCDATTSDSPDDVAEAWFSAAVSGSDARMAELLDPRCADAPVGQGAPAHMRGMHVNVEDLDLVTTKVAGDEATVAYTFRGEVHTPKETRETEVHGTAVTVTTGPTDVDMGDKSGTLSLVRMDGQWKVTCAFAGMRNP